MKSLVALSALVVCALATTPVSGHMATFHIGQYNATYPTGCRIATLAEFQSDAFRKQYNSDTHLPRLGSLDEDYLNCAVMAQDSDSGRVGCLRDEFYYQSYYANETGKWSWVCGRPYGKGYPAKMKLGGWKRSTYDFDHMTKAKQMGTYIAKDFTPADAGPTIALVYCSNSDDAASTITVSDDKAESSPRSYYEKMTGGNATYYIGKYNNSVDYPLYPGCKVATLEQFQSDEFRAQYNSDMHLPKLGTIGTAINCGPMVQTSSTDSHIGCLKTHHNSYFGPYFLNGTGFCFGDYPDKMNLGHWPSTSDGFQTMTKEIQRTTVVGQAFGPIWSGPTIAVIRCGGVPPTPPTPAPSQNALVQLRCSNSGCSQGCTNHSFPTGQCLPVQGGGSAKVTCTETTITEAMYQNADCSGMAQTQNSPANTCEQAQGGGYLENICEVNKGKTLRNSALEGDVFLHRLTSHRLSRMK